MFKRLFDGFCSGFTHISRKSVIRKDKKLRDELSEKQIDKMLSDSFPASDPPSTY